MSPLTLLELLNSRNSARRSSAVAAKYPSGLEKGSSVKKTPYLSRFNSLSPAAHFAPSAGDAGAKTPNTAPRTSGPGFRGRIFFDAPGKLRETRLLLWGRRAGKTPARI